MPPEFHQAARRHLDDARYLRDDHRWRNADQLGGYAYECALKAAMVGLGMPLNPRGADRVHADGVGARFQIHASSRGQSRYLAFLPDPDPFSTWKVDDRYLGGDGVPGRELEDRLAAAARVTEGLLAEMVLDGWLP